MDFDCCVKSARNRDGLILHYVCLSGKCCNQLGLIARISELAKFRGVLLIIYQLHGMWNICSNLLWLLTTSVFHLWKETKQSWFLKWFSHPAEKVRWKCLILQELDLGLYKYICVVGKKYFTWNMVLFQLQCPLNPPVKFYHWLALGTVCFFWSYFPCLCFIHIFRWDAGSSVLQQLDCTKLLNMGCCFLVIWEEKFASLWMNT